MKQKRLLARLLALLFALVFAVSFVLPTFARGDLFADFTHQIPWHFVAFGFGHHIDATFFDIYSI